MDHVQQLISGYLDGELSGEEASELASALEKDAASVDRLVFHSFIHAQMLEWMDHLPARARMSSTALEAEPRRAMHMASGTLRGDMPGRRTGAMQATSSHWPRLAVAAAIFIAAGVIALAYSLAMRPGVVGQLSQATSCRWAPSQPAPSVGTLFDDGQELVLEQGTALVTFVSGAQLQLEGPTSLRLVSEQETHLHYGQIAAKVPTTARGFTVTSPLGRFIDLGTEFTLRLDAEKSFVLHVFEGLVELQLDERFGESASQPVRVAEVRAVLFDVATGEVAVKQFEEGKQMPF
jgi:ferric-dicitrate binding protein FerR (iron transport regulator)